MALSSNQFFSWLNWILLSSLKLLKRVCTTPLTFKIHLSIPIEVYISQDLVDLAVVELLPHELLHGLPQLSEADLTVAVRVKLRGGTEGGGKKMHWN